ncbi:unnamed protein product [Mytilus coruscus]|uniref:Uncharacterized protein n=1 Tax=Mytilus coruscus TaxID=42192 RepID=A0A6J8D7A0_MYTCO|nr:unnamed protein product [Mytilus coruscus]
MSLYKAPKKQFEIFREEEKDYFEMDFTEEFEQSTAHMPLSLDSHPVPEEYLYNMVYTQPEKALSCMELKAEMTLFILCLVMLIVKESVSTTEVWFPVFIAFSGNGKSVLEAWKNQALCNDLPTSFVTEGTNRHLRNNIIDNWNTANIKTVKIEFFKNDHVVAWMTFNGRNTDKMNWFSKANLADSSFNDLESCSTFNFFSITGNSQRKFYVNKSYHGCPGDDGWFVVIDQTPYCTWEKQGAIPLFLYTKNFTPRNWTNDRAVPADTMIVSLILTVLIVVSLPQCICVVFQPPQQPVQVVIVEDPGEDQPDFFVIEDRFAARGTDTGIGLGASFPFLSMLFLIIVTMVPMMDMVKMAPMINMVTNEMMGKMATSTTTSTTTQAQPAASKY